MADNKAKPLLAAAFICERILREVDGVLTAVSIVDRFTVAVQDPRQERLGVKAWILVTFKSGDVSGNYSVSFVMRFPTGENAPLGEPLPIELKGGSHGTSLVIDATLEVRVEGLYWIDVLLDGERVTSMPLTITLQRSGEGQEPPRPPSS
jgi:hypothetical protein